MRKVVFLFNMTFWAWAVPLFCADAPMAAITLTADTKWSVAFSTFEGINLSPENDHLVKSVPFLIKGELESIDKHYFDDRSKSSYRKALVYDKLREQYTALKQSQKTRDDLVFDNMLPDAREKKITEIELAISKITTTISALTQYDASTIAFPDSLPVQIISGEKDDVLLEAPKYSALQFAIDKKINLLVRGRIEEIQGYIKLDIEALDRAEEADIYSFNMVVAPDELSTAIEKAKEGIAGAILGTEWGTLVLTVDPVKAIFYMDGEFIGIGNTRLTYVPTGKKKITAEAPGYATKNFETEIIAQKEITLDIILEKRDLAKIRIVSEPSGADVYVNSEWVGKTPLDLEKTREMKRVLVTMKDFDQYSFHVDQSSGDEIPIVLVRHSIDYNARQTEARDNFYMSFGFLLVSIAFPVFINGYMQDYAAEIRENGSSTPPFDGYYLNYNILNGSYYGALTVTCVLSVTTVIYLIQYLISADRPFG
jgi:hypothetical protein